MTLEQLFNELKTKDSTGLNAIEKLRKNIVQFFNDNPYSDTNLITPEYIKSAIQSLSIRQNFFIEDYFSENNNKDSIFGIVQEHIDMSLDNMDISQFLQENGKSFWKNSINTLIKNVWYNYNPPKKGEIDYKNITENLDAGLSFLEKTSAQDSDYVYENINHENSTFDNIVVNNLILKDGLTNPNHINETNLFSDEDAIKVKKSINLLMPKNSRRVEAIDLNRNFWVISNSLSSILTFLFEDDNLLATNLKGITREITELWENLLYLWAAAYIAYGYKSRPLHFEILYMPNNKYQSYKKGDNFECDISNVSNMTNILKERFFYMKKRYPNCNLCIIPIVRKDNYEHNYYSTEMYPGILYSRYNSNNFIYDTFIYGGSLSTIPSVSADESCDAMIYLDGIGSTDTDDYTDYNSIYIRPFSAIANFKELKSHKYYCGYRMIPEIEYTYFNGILTITKMNFLFTDIMYSSITSGISANLGDMGTLYTSSEIVYNFNKTNTGSIRALLFKANSAITSTNKTLRNAELLRKVPALKKYNYYLGECLSSTTNSDFADFNLDLNILELRPDVTSATDATSLIITGTDTEKQKKKEGLRYGQKEIIQNNTQWKNTISNKDVPILSIKAKKNNTLSEFSSLDVNMRIYIGYHKIDLWQKNGESTRTITYTELNANSSDIKTVTLTNQPSEQTHTVYNGAVLYDPLYNNIYKYPYYFFYGYYAPYINYIEYSRDKNGGDSWLEQNNIYNYSYFYIKKGEQLSSDNWILRYVQVCGVKNFENSVFNSYASGTTWEEVIASLWPTSLRMNKWDKNGTMDSYNPIPTKINYDCWALPDNVRDSYKYSLPGETAITYTTRTAQYEATITAYKNDYISKMKYYNSHITHYTTQAYVTCDIHFEYIDIKTDEYGATYYDYNEKFYTDMEWLKNNLHLNGYTPLNYYTQTGRPVWPITLRAGYYNKNYYTTAEITKAVHWSETYLAMEAKTLYKESENGPVIEGIQLNLKTPYKEIYEREHNSCANKILVEKTKYNNWVAGFENSLKDLQQHYVFNKTVTAYPLNVQIRTHLFTPNGYACKIQSLDFPEESIVGNTISTSTYTTEYIADGVVEEGTSSAEEAYNNLRNQLPNSKEDSSIIYTYYMDSSDAKQERTISNKIQKVFLDYERFPRNGINK